LLQDDGPAHRVLPVAPPTLREQQMLKHDAGEPDRMSSYLRGNQIRQKATLVSSKPPGWRATCICAARKKTREKYAPARRISPALPRARAGR
jgi:hypothetical protein